MIRPTLLLLALTVPALARTPIVKIVAPTERCPRDAPHEVVTIDDAEHQFRVCVEDVKP